MRCFSGFWGFLGHPVQHTVTLIKRSMLGRGGAPCNGLYVQFVPRFVPCPFEYSTFLIACLDEYLLN